jgi:hypothetical protein
MADKIREAVRRVAERQSVLPNPDLAKRVFPPAPVCPVPDTGYSQALLGMVDRLYLKSAKYGDQQRRVDFDLAHPVVAEFSHLFVRRMASLGVPMFPHCVFRSKEEQETAFKLGHSKARYGDSPHNFGCAVDIIHSRHLWDLSPRQWQLIGHVGKELAAAKGFKLVWGGDWKRYPDAVIGWDPAHWQLANWREVRG